MQRVKRMICDRRIPYRSASIGQLCRKDCDSERAEKRVFHVHSIGKERIRTRVSSKITTLPCSSASDTFGKLAMRIAT